MKEQDVQVPLSRELHSKLRAESDRWHPPVTQLAREAIESHQLEQCKLAAQEAIADYARRHAGSETDIDEDLALVGEEELIRAVPDETA